MAVQPVPTRPYPRQEDYAHKESWRNACYKWRKQFGVPLQKDAFTAAFERSVPRRAPAVPVSASPEASPGEGEPEELTGPAVGMPSALPSGDEAETPEGMRARQARMLRLAMDVCERGLTAISRALDLEPDADTKSLIDLPKLLNTVMHFQRLLAGEATANVNVQNAGDDWDLSAWSNEDLATLQALRDKYRA